MSAHCYLETHDRGVPSSIRDVKSISFQRSQLRNKVIAKTSSTALVWFLPCTQILRLLGKIGEARFQIEPRKLTFWDGPLRFSRSRPFERNSLGSHTGTFWMSSCNWSLHQKLTVDILCFCFCQRKEGNPLARILLSPGIEDTNNNQRQIFLIKTSSLERERTLRLGVQMFISESRQIVASYEYVFLWIYFPTKIFSYKYVFFLISFQILFLYKYIFHQIYFPTNMFPFKYFPLQIYFVFSFI